MRLRFQNLGQNLPAETKYENLFQFIFEQQKLLRLDSNIESKSSNNTYLKAAVSIFSVALVWLGRIGSWGDRTGFYHKKGEIVSLVVNDYLIC